MTPSLTGPQALYLCNLAEEVHAGGARPEFHLTVQWDARRQRIYAEVSITAFTLRGGGVEQVQGNINFLQVTRARTPPSSLHMHRAAELLGQTNTLHYLEFADTQPTYLLNGGGDPHRVLLCLRVPSHWYNALHSARQHFLHGVADGVLTPRRECHLSLDGTADWTMPQALARCHSWRQPPRLPAPA